MSSLLAREADSHLLSLSVYGLPPVDSLQQHGMPHTRTVHDLHPLRRRSTSTGNPVRISNPSGKIARGTANSKVCWGEKGARGTDDARPFLSSSRTRGGVVNLLDKLTPNPAKCQDTFCFTRAAEPRCWLGCHEGPLSQFFVSVSGQLRQRVSIEALAGRRRTPGERFHHARPGRQQGASRFVRLCS